ncbi:MAG: lysylphosphatidylglycerol synthase transmembrane domain-containing protein [Cyclobacteriaceae bacterium]
MIILAGGLLWLSLKSIPDVEGESRSEFIWKTWERSNKVYLFIMAFVAMLSHVLRAYRWKMLLVPTGNKIKMSSSFLSLMIGYLVNLAVPRGGEISRCYNLLKLEKTPVEISFGTVVAERVVDVLCLIILIGISFFVEWDKLMTFIQSLPISPGGGNSIFKWALIIGGSLAILAVSVYFLRRNEKIKKIIEGFKEGLLAVFRLKHSWLFVFLSILIWVLYFIMSYFVIIAFEETAVLEFSAVLTLFAMGAIAMAAPLPGGAGSYHTIVPLGLVMLYNLPQGDAIAFVFIFHAWQTFILIVAGVLSLIISYWILRWKQ